MESTVIESTTIESTQENGLYGGSKQLLSFPNEELSPLVPQFTVLVTEIFLQMPVESVLLHEKLPRQPIRSQPVIGFFSLAHEVS